MEIYTQDNGAAALIEPRGRRCSSNVSSWAGRLVSPGKDFKCLTNRVALKRIDHDEQKFTNVV